MTPRYSSYARLAKAAKISRSYIHDIRTGRRIASAQVAARLEGATGISRSTFLYDDPEKIGRLLSEQVQPSRRKE